MDAQRQGPSPHPTRRTDGWLHVCRGRRDLYWKPLRQQDVSDRKEGKINNWKNDEKWEENKMLDGRSVLWSDASSSGEGGNSGDIVCLHAQVLLCPDHLPGFIPVKICRAWNRQTDKETNYYCSVIFKVFLSRVHSSPFLKKNKWWCKMAIN